MTQKKRGKVRNEDRDLSLILGLKTYRGSMHDCGTDVRYISNNACVKCSRERALADYHAKRNHNVTQRDTSHIFTSCDEATS
jgi:hypothetical protein